MVTAFMAQQRTKRRQTGTVRAILAYMSSRMDGRTSHWPQHHTTIEELLEGARAACADKGYLLEKFYWNDYEANPRRLFTSLRTRRIQGAIFTGEIPLGIDQLTQWEDYAVTAITQSDSSKDARFNASGADHHFNTWLIMDKLNELGYSRIANASTYRTWMIRNRYSYQSAFLGWEACAGRRIFRIYWKKRWDRNDFLKWVECKKPQVIISAEHAPLEFLKSAGYRIPDDIGFVHQDLDSRWTDLAGIRQNHLKVGEAAAFQVIDQINRNCYGAPDIPQRVLAPGRWFQGPSVKKMQS